MATLPVQLELDRRSTAAVAREVEEALSDAAKNITRDFNRNMSGLGGDTFRRVGRDAGNSLRDEIRGSMDEAVRGVTSQFGAMGRVADQAFAAIPRGAGLAAVGVAGVGLAAVAAGKQLYDLGAMWDNVVDSITGRTGMVGAELTALTNTVKDLASSTALPIAEIGNIAGQVAQSLNLSGDAAARMIQTLSQVQQVTGQGVDTKGLGRTFQLFDIEAAGAQVAAVEDLLRVSQATGISINELIGAVQSSGKAAKEFGLDFSETAGLIATMENAGLDFARTAPSLSIALKNFARDGREPQEALRDTIAEIKALSDAQQNAAAIDLAQRTFGKGYLDFLDAIKSGQLTVDSLNTSLDKAGASLAEQVEATEDGTESWQKFTNTLSGVLKPAADAIFGGLNSHLQYLTGHMTEATTQLERMAAVPITPDSALGRMLLPAGGPGALGTPRDTGIGSAFTRTTTLDPNAPSRWTTPGGPFSDPNASSPSAAPGRPSTPVVPMSGDPMSLLQGFAPTSALYGAAESVLTARHSRAQAEAELHALEARNDATAEEIQTAKNKIAKADSDILQSELRLSEAKQSATEKLSNQMNDATLTLEDVGARLDADFGISQGLGGIAENITKFVANLAAAPILGQWQAIAQTSPSQGGYGMMGILGAQGAFGPNYTGIDYVAQAQAAMSSVSMPSSAISSAVGPYPTGAAYPAVGGVPYAGVPLGSDMDVTNQPGLDLLRSMGLRGATYSSHTTDGASTDREIDVTDPVGGYGSSKLTQLAEFARQNPGLFEEFIYSDPTTGQKTGIRSGELVGPGTSQPQYYASNWAGHQDHVHMEPAKGGGLGGYTASSSPVPVNVVSAPGMQQWSAPTPTPPAQNTSTGVGSYPAPTSSPPTAGPPLSVLPGAGAGTTWGTDAPLGLPISGGAGESPLFGAPQGPGVGAGVGNLSLGAPLYGGVDPISGTGKGGGIGVTPGGTIDTAINMAASMFPGMGQAAATGVKLISRGIEYGGQVAGIMTQGWMDTFLPMGGSKLAQNNWITRAIGGIAGAGAALPNVAGKKGEGALTPQQVQAQQQHGQGGSPGPGNTNITVNNNRATEDGTGRDIAYHQQNMYAQPGTP